MSKRPFLKWAGNKYRLLDSIRALLPKGRRLVEPFAGSGAVFLNTDYRYNLVADANPDLISLFKILQKEGEAFIDYSRTFFTPEANTREVFLERRVKFNTTKNKREKAALFVYFNRHGYNGLCRYNSKHIFNVPFGRYTNPRFPEEEMRHFHERAKKAVFRCQSFVDTLKTAREGDVIYCDPPYVPLSKTSSFTGYDSSLFGQKEQLELSRLAKRLSRKGIPVLISNHNTEFTRATYSTAHQVALQVSRSISCKGNGRGKASELLALFTR